MLEGGGPPAAKDTQVDLNVVKDPVEEGNAGLCFTCSYHLYHMTGYVGWPPVKDPVEEGKAYSWRFSEEEIRGMTNSLRLSCTWQGSYMKGSLFEKCNLIYPASVLISYFLSEESLEHLAGYMKEALFEKCKYIILVPFRRGWHWLRTWTGCAFCTDKLPADLLCSNGFNPIRTDLQKQALPFGQCSNLGP